MSDSTTRMADYLAEHPKMAGALFTMLLLLSQAGSVMAGSGQTTVGP